LAQRGGEAAEVRADKFERSGRPRSCKRRARRRQARSESTAAEPGFKLAVGAGIICSKSFCRLRQQQQPRTVCLSLRRRPRESGSIPAGRLTRCTSRRADRRPDTPRPPPGTRHGGVQRARRCRRVQPRAPPPGRHAAPPHHRPNNGCPQPQPRRAGAVPGAAHARRAPSGGVPRQARAALHPARGLPRQAAAARPPWLCRPRRRRPPGSVRLARSRRDQGRRGDAPVRDQRAPAAADGPPGRRGARAAAARAARLAARHRGQRLPNQGAAPRRCRGAGAVVAQPDQPAAGRGGQRC
jgi:hypothetical protein